MAWFRSRRGVDDLSDEVRAHVEHEADELRAAGWSDEAARAEAIRRFGSPTRVTEDAYLRRPGRAIETLGQDVRYALRLMQRSPAFSITAVVVLALGIGVNTALFSVVNALFFAPLPVRAPDELFYVFREATGPRMLTLDRRPDDRVFFMERTSALADYAGHTQSRPRLTVDGETSLVWCELVTANYFELVGVRVARGRLLGPADESSSPGDAAIVISHEFWTRQFDADPDVLGTRVRLQDLHATIVGVAEEGFTGLTDPWSRSQVWILGAAMQAALLSPDSRAFVGTPIGRLKPGVEFAQVEAAFASALPEWRQQEVARIQAAARPERFDELRQTALQTRFPIYRAAHTRSPFDPDAEIVPPALLAGMSALVALVLVISTANIAGLLLARGVTRTGEIAVRRALGAGSMRVIRQLVTESVVLAAAGGGLGLALAVTAIGLVRAYTPSQYSIAVPLDMRVLAFTAAVCLGAGFLVGLLPAAQALRVRVAQALGHGLTGSRSERRWLRRWVLIPQIALSLVVLLVAAVHARALLRMEQKDRGYHTGDSVVLGIDSRDPAARIQDPVRLMEASFDERRRASDQLTGRVRALNLEFLDRLSPLPQVAAAALTMGLPFTGGGPGTAHVHTREGANGQAHPPVWRTAVSSRYFDAMGMRLVRGRTFDDRETPDRPRVAVVSEMVARSLWPSRDPIGQSFAFGTPGPRAEWFEVIGIVNDVTPLLSNDAPSPRVYVSVMQEPIRALPIVLVRGHGEPGELIRETRAALLAADPLLEIWRVQTLRQMADDLLFPRRMAVAVLVVAGLTGLVLACIGLYGIASYSVAERQREIGIRATLGVNRADIAGLVLREGARVALAGTVAGAGAAILALRWSASLAPYVPTTDMTSFVLVPAVLLSAVTLASLVPAHRAAKVDPASVLRGE